MVARVPVISLLWRKCQTPPPGGRPSRSPLRRRRRFPGSITRRLPDGGFARGFAAEEQRVEVGSVIVGIEVFAPLEKADYQVRKRCSNYLVHHFEYPLCEDGCEHQLRRNEAPKGDADKDQRVKALTYQRRADGTHP